MTLHVFNPEHDIALASGLANFTAPHAGRVLRHDLAFLPALWAEPGDAVLVDDVEAAARQAGRLKVASKVMFVTRQQLAHIHIDHVEPWGWDSALRAFLIRCGLDSTILPGEATLDDIRELSRRSVAAWLLPQLRSEGTVGESFECDDTSQVMPLVERFGHVVVKAPWSSSGRGLRFLDSSESEIRNEVSGWLRHVVESQRSVMVEPYYNKVKDFAMEFHSDGEGTLSYEGLSLFHTENGAYTGNLLITEAESIKRLTHYIPEGLLLIIRQKIQSVLGSFLKGRYCGPVGVDMMIVSQPLNGNNDCGNQGAGFLLHPCVEINLRRTMGHVALAVERRLNATLDDEVRHVMRIRFADNNYRLRIKRL
jgi:hypothetical protein